MTDADTQPQTDENHLIAERRAKLAALRTKGIAFPNDFRRADHAGDLQAEYGDVVKDTPSAHPAGHGGRRCAGGRD